jgi:hypothetical protein
VSLALTGTIPSLEEIRWLQSMPENERLDWWLDRLLSDRRSSDYLAERFARAYVGIENGPFLVYRRRRFVTWISDQLYENRPYDALVRELISGTGLWTDSPAVNFVTVTNDINGDEQPDEQRLAARTARAFLGVRLDCVQCHDDNLGGPWRQPDFQQLAAFFASAQSSLLGIRDVAQDYEFQYLHREAKEVVEPRPPFATDLVPNDGSPRERLAAWVTHPRNGAFARAMVNRVWAILFGQPLHDPIDDLPLQGPYPPGLELLANDFVTHGHDLRRLVGVIVHTQAFQRASSPGEADGTSHACNWSTFPRTRLRAEQMAGSVLQASSLRTLDAHSHILVRLAQMDQRKDFVKRFGDKGEDEFRERSATIPQQLLMMNGQLVRERTKDDLVANAVTRIHTVASDPETALRTTYWTIFTRAPSAAEIEYFLPRLQQSQGPQRREALEDIYWTLINSMEFAWNH